MNECTVCGFTEATVFYKSRNDLWPGRWCRPCYKRFMKHGSPVTKVYSSRNENKNWLKFQLETADRDKCWIWPFAKTNGYGHLTINKKNMKASHYVLELDGRPRPSQGLIALHSCDTPACVNPSHLRWGSMSENSQDMVKRGRSRNHLTGPIRRTESE